MVAMITGRVPRFGASASHCRPRQGRAVWSCASQCSAVQWCLDSRRPYLQICSALFKQSKFSQAAFCG